MTKFLDKIKLLESFAGVWW